MITTSARAGDDKDHELVERVGAAARAGVHLIQIRQPQFDGRALSRLVERSVRVTKGTAARILVNDRVDVALAAGAHGVHLRGGSMSAARVRDIVPQGFVIGRSVHSADECARVAREGDLDYLLFGTVFATHSKPGIVAVGTDALVAACTGVTIPVLAVGGMTALGVGGGGGEGGGKGGGGGGRRLLGAVAGAGAAGWAAVGLFADCRYEEIRSVVQEAFSVFDTAEDVF